MTNPAGRLLGGNAFGTLTKAEKEELYRAALDDQELFDALVEDEALREALTDPAVRHSLLDQLEQPTFLERVRNWFNQPATLAHLSVATGVLFVAFVGWQLVGPYPSPLRGVGADGPTAAGPGRPAPDPRTALFALPTRTAIPVVLEGEAPTFLFTVEEGARALVIERRPDGSAVQLFPAAGRGSAVPAGEKVQITGGQEPGVHRVRFLVCPPDVEPLTLDVRALTALGGRATLIERTYEWKAGGQAS
jgi:hypothetical protein